MDLDGLKAPQPNQEVINSLKFEGGGGGVEMESFEGGKFARGSSLRFWVLNYIKLHHNLSNLPVCM